MNEIDNEGLWIRKSGCCAPTFLGVSICYWCSYKTLNNQQYLCNKSLTPICLYKYIFIHTQDIELYPLYRKMVGLSVYLSTHKAIKLYPLYRTLVGLSMYLSTHKAIKLYPLYRTIVGLSVYLSTHKAIKLYPLYRTIVGLSVYLSTHKAIRLYPLY